MTVATTRRTDNTLTPPENWHPGASGESADNSSSTSEQRVAVSHYTSNEDASDPAAWGSSGTAANPHAATIALKRP